MIFLYRIYEKLNDLFIYVQMSKTTLNMKQSFILGKTIYCLLNTLNILVVLKVSTIYETLAKRKIYGFTRSGF